MLFDVFTRTDSSVGSFCESQFNFYNRHAGQYWAQARDLLEDWVSRVPVPNQKGILGRLQRGKDDQFLAAFWEVYLSETLTKAGYEVEWSPVNSNEKRRPDFLVDGPEGRFWLEATSTSMSKDGGRNSRKYRFIDDINECIDSPNFFLSLDFKKIGDQTPSLKKLIPDLRTWLSGLNPDTDCGPFFDVDEYEWVTPELAEEFPDLRKHLVIPPDYRIWKDRGWHVVFNAIPRSLETRGLLGRRVVGMMGAETLWGTGAKSLVNALKLKRLKRYPCAHDLPYIVAIRSIDNRISDPYECELEAFYGSQKIVYMQDGRYLGEDAYLIRPPSGFWLNSKGWNHQEVSGVLLGSLNSAGPQPFNVTSNTPVLWHHNQPFYEAPFVSIWDHVKWNNREICVQEANTQMHDVLGLPKDWPLGDPYPQVS